MKNNNWFSKALFYEIYPQTFLDTNGDGIGDIQGIIQKLDYIQSIGFNAIWLNPLFDSPFFDAGYDVRDYYKVAPRYGTNEDLYQLFKEVHKRGMHIILDLVPGHTSIDSEWFKKSCLQEKNEFSDLYIWTNSIWKAHDDIPSIRGFYERDGSVATNFFSIQPALNYGFWQVKNDYEMKIDDPRVEKTIKAMQDVIVFYLEKGADGFRVDMAGWLAKRDDEKFSGTIYIWDKILKPIKEKYPEAFFVSEWSSPKDALRTYFDSDFLLQDAFRPLHIYMCRGEDPYFKVSSKKSAKEYFDFYLDTINFAFKRNKYVSIVSGNHDTVRISKTLEDDEELKLFYALMYTLPGIPFMYYGDEIGMKYLENAKSVEGGYHRTGSRLPMAWDDSMNGGFSSAKETYTPISKEYHQINVKNELEDKNSLLNFIKRLIAFRKEYRAFDNDAGLVYLNKDDEELPLRYLRYKENENIGIIINPRDQKAPLTLYEPYKIIYQYNNEDYDGKTINPQSIIIARFS